MAKKTGEEFVKALDELGDKQGMSRKALLALFQVHDSTVFSWIRPIPKSKPSKKLAISLAVLENEFAQPSVQVKAAREWLKRAGRNERQSDDDLEKLIQPIRDDLRVPGGVKDELDFQKVLKELPEDQRPMATAAWNSQAALRNDLKGFLERRDGDQNVFHHHVWNANRSGRWLHMTEQTDFYIRLMESQAGRKGCDLTLTITLPTSNDPTIQRREENSNLPPDWKYRHVPGLYTAFRDLCETLKLGLPAEGGRMHGKFRLFVRTVDTFVHKGSDVWAFSTDGKPFGYVVRGIADEDQLGKDARVNYVKMRATRIAAKVTDVDTIALLRTRFIVRLPSTDESPIPKFFVLAKNGPIENLPNFELKQLAEIEHKLQRQAGEWIQQTFDVKVPPENLSVRPWEEISIETLQPL